MKNEVKKENDTLVDNDKVQQDNFNKFLENMKKRNLVLDSTPVQLMFGLTNVCNLHCAFCPYCGFCTKKSEKSEMLPIEAVNKLKKFMHMAGIIISAGKGESLAYNKFKEFMKICKDTGAIRRMQIVNNGTLIDRYDAKIFEGINVFSISFESTNKEVFEILRYGANYEKVLSNVIEMRRELPDIVMQFSVTVNRLNMEELVNIYCLAKEIGINYISFNSIFGSEKDKVIQLLRLRESDRKIVMNQLEQIAKLNSNNVVAIINEMTWSQFEDEVVYNKQKVFEQLQELKNITPYLTSDEKENHKKENQRVKQENRRNKKSEVALPYCTNPFCVMYIQSNQDILPCCMTWGGIDNLSEKSAWDVWNGQEYQLLREAMFDYKMLPEICRECQSFIRYDFINDYIEKIKEDGEMDYEQLIIPPNYHPPIGLIHDKSIVAKIDDYNQTKADKSEQTVIIENGYNFMTKSKTWGGMMAEIYKTVGIEEELWLANDIEKILRQHGLQEGDSLVEMGWGNSHLSAYFAQKGYKVTVVDSDPIVLEKAKKIFEKFGVEGEFVFGDLFCLGERLCVHDYAWNSGVMERFDDKEIISLMKSMDRYAEKGVLYLVPNSESIAYLLMRARLVADDEWIYSEEYLRRDYVSILKRLGYQYVEKSYVSAAAVSAYQMWKAEKEQGNISELYRKLMEEDMLPKQEGYLVSYYASKIEDTVQNEKYSGTTVKDTKVFDLVAKKIGYDEIKKENINLQCHLQKSCNQGVQIENHERQIINRNMEEKEMSLHLFGNNKNKEDYRIFLRYMLNDIDEFSNSIDESLCEDEVMEFLTCLLISVGRNGFKSAERKKKLFYKAEALGMHLVLAHFYNPIPVLSELEPLKTDFGKQIEFLNYNDDKFFSLLELFSTFKEEVFDVPSISDKKEYYYENNAIGGIDAIMYYYMIRYFKPQKVIEVGAGYSTLIAAKAAKKNKNTYFTSIEPYPMDLVQKGVEGLDELRVEKLQEVPLSLFEQLEENDILFIDSSHVLKAGSDVTYMFTTILPRLKKGVIIHFHDMFIPYEIPDKWTREELLFWNEQYVLYSILINAKNEYETIMPNYYLGSNYRERLLSYFPPMPEVKIYDDISYWIKKSK